MMARGTRLRLIGFIVALSLAIGVPAALAYSSSSVYWGSATVGCNNCFAIVSVQAWSSSQNGPEPLALFSGHCSVGPAGIHFMGDSNTIISGNWWVSSDIFVPSGYCTSVAYRLSFGHT
jgi:hypothetical protein